MTEFNNGALLWCVPLAYVLACLPVALGAGISRSWAVAEGAALAALVMALAAIAQQAFSSALTDKLGLAMLMLVSLLGWVVLRYSRRYLNGEAGQKRYLLAMLLTLASIGVVVVTHNLGVLVLAWIASSVALHYLLTFYRDRPAALVVAHKKFIASRLAEVCLLAALTLIYLETGTLAFQGIADHVQSANALSAALNTAMALVVLAVILKSAQLPVHGWLIQVMEAPTPVSALLHAGIVNLGGFLLIRLALMLSASPTAQTLLVVVGSLSAVLAGLVMMTRISIKVRLAWSTCAQMGFMLLECGLGLYELAFLHLVAHSLYKAYAFLAAGEAVLDSRRRAFFPPETRRSSAASVVMRLLCVPLAIGLLAGSVAVWQMGLPGLTISPVAVLIVGLGLAPLLWRADGWGIGTVRGVIAILVLGQFYIAGHLVFGALVETPAATASLPLTLWAGGCLALLYLLQVWLLAFPRGQFAKAFYPWAYAGFYLDERFTRLTFRIWPISLPAVSLRSPHPIAALLSEKS
ncbi:NADH-quinone oxidoreductase subunit L [Polaromonas sp.]|uniref:NADH-quinone oxidoreductase subunit L n=1 Tax=Polaromonas sp. TaxID=1869339 RepID=UPI0013BC0C29|nr:NADH-quinone oxidoreductase subunit L [Polaromonas sp.]NDP62162.1 NADH-quinone oxidoreductase subunit L [Polaromonas sp.]